jgi:hypothetical protein
MADQPPGGHSHLISFPEALEIFFTRMNELKLLLDPREAGNVGQVETLLRDALAARGRGDVPVAVARIGQAMDRLAALASTGDPGEGAMMRAMAEHFRQALVRGAMGDAKEAAETMRERSGSTVTPRKDR